MTNKSREQLKKGSSIVRGKDGVYRWEYAVPMLGNLSILFTMWKVMGISLCVPTLLMLIMGLMQGKGLEAVGFALKIALLALCFMLVVSLPAYLIVAALYGWKYAIRFEMDERGIRHRPDKVVAIGWQMRLMAAMGCFDRYTECRFSRVKSIKTCPHLNLIKVNAPFNKNQVYVEPKDFNFVLGFIASRCPEAKVDR